jgi:hypothetical protein
MLEYNQIKILKNNLFHFIFIEWEIKIYLGNKCNVLVYSKAQIYSQNNLNDF